MATGQATASDKLAQCLEDLQASDENSTVETRWCHLRDAVHSTALGVLGRARRQHHDRFDENDTAISNLFAEKNLLHRDCLDRPPDAKKTAFFQCRHLGRQRLQEMQDAWKLARPRGSRGMLTTMKCITTSLRSRRYAVPKPKELRCSSDPMDQRF
ncbi:hypothetical protein SprV_0200798900 [Sparganum proliferum]